MLGRRFCNQNLRTPRYAGATDTCPSAQSDCLTHSDREHGLMRLAAALHEDVEVRMVQVMVVSGRTKRLE